MQTKNVILLSTMWLIMLSTYSYALLNNYVLFISDHLGFTGLCVATVIAFTKPSVFPKVMLFILALGSLNVLSFLYFYNIVFSFGFGILISPGIQAYSLLVLIILITINRGLLTASMQFMAATTDEDLKEKQIVSRSIFQTRFEKLESHDLKRKLEDDLAPEARAAIEAILANRESNKP